MRIGLQTNKTKEKTKNEETDYDHDALRDVR
jgi:hypothetical protein